MSLPTRSSPTRSWPAGGGCGVAQGEIRRGLDDLLACGQVWDAFDPPDVSIRWRSPAALAHAALGEHEQATRLADHAVRTACSFGAPHALGNALRTAGLIAGGESGVRLLREAVTVLEGAPALLDRAAALTRPRHAGGATRPRSAGTRAAVARAGARRPLRSRPPRSAGSSRDQPDRLAPAAHRAQRPRRAYRGRAPRESDGRSRTDQPANRPGAFPLREDDREPPHARLREARHRFPSRAGQGADRAGGRVEVPDAPY